MAVKATRFIAWLFRSHNATHQVVVAYIGSYNPHTKQATIQVEAAQKYLDNGAQPSPRVIKLLQEAGVSLPKWVKPPVATKHKAIKNAEKLRKNQPKEDAASSES